MVLTRVDGRTVRGLPDWEVEEFFPNYLEYREGGRVLQISAEGSTGPETSIILYHCPRATWWQPPHRAEPLTPDEVRPCLVRITAAVVMLGVRPIWETEPVGEERSDWPVILAEARALLHRAE